MFQLKLTTRPDHFDEYGRPCYLISQRKGLIEYQNNRLLEDALADGYVTSVANTLHRWIANEVALASAGRKLDLLEIGGGVGGLFEWVKDRARSYINVEPGRIIPEGSALERLQDPRYACIKCSAEDVPLEDESVDVIISTASFDHIPEYRRALSEVRRLLRKNGSLILTLNNRRSWWKILLSGTAYLRKREQEIAREHYFQWSFSECESNLADFVPIRQITTLTYFPFVPKIWQYLLPLSDFIGGFLLRRYGAYIVAVCQKRG
jgi:ubiquinone/menaquinone biosynthesis C-methylase UbiE